ncbi:MAG: tryptophan halogenase, partial [Pirellulaceae bacterium]
MSALAIRRMLPSVSVTVVHSSQIPVIGVGESTTAFVPRFLHQHLGLDRKEFYEAVRPSWKLGIRFEWGCEANAHFYYPFDNSMGIADDRLPRVSGSYCFHDFSDASHYIAIMERGLSPCVTAPDGRYFINDDVGYHIGNGRFLSYLQRKFSQFGGEIVDANVVDVKQRENGDVESLVLQDGRDISGDLFVDCSGFRSRLLRETLRVPRVDYSDSLFCDSAVVGSWQRTDAIMPFTTAESMDHGWCWKIEFEERVTRGYVFSSQFCTAAEAMDELKQKNPQIDDDIREIKFSSGRYENYWVRNVVAIGNSGGFVEPLEATALHLIGEQVSGMAKILSDADMKIDPAMQTVENQRYRDLWDEVRDFLALHYKFNAHVDTDFWRHCRNDTDLKQLAPLVDFYQRVGPVRQCHNLLPKDTIFGFHGYLTMLVGLRVPTARKPEFSSEELANWDVYRQDIRNAISRTIPVRD